MMRKSDNQVVLTGGAGFIGSHLAEALLLRGSKVAIIDSLDDFYSHAWKKANLEDIRRVEQYEFLQLDICDFAGGPPARLQTPNVTPGRLSQIRRVVQAEVPERIPSAGQPRIGIGNSVLLPPTLNRCNAFVCSWKTS